jgi:hypothetical protein
MYTKYIKIINPYRLENNLKIKIADFGLCREVNQAGAYYAEKSRVAFRWTAPECFKRYGFAGDVVRIWKEFLINTFIDRNRLYRFYVRKSLLICM